MYRHRAVLRALLDTLYPALPADAAQAQNAGDQDAAVAFALSASDVPFIVEQVEESITRLAPEIQRELGWLFELLAWRAGALALGGVAALTAAFPFCAAFPELSLAQREAVLLSWANSPLFLFRKAFKGVKSLLLNTVLCAVDAHGRNPIWPVLEYPGPDPHRPARPLPARLAAEAALEAAMVDLAAAAGGGAAELARRLRAAGFQASEGADGDGDVVVDCDAVVVGSGAGGGVAAALLAQAGLKVVVVEKGKHAPAAALSLLERDAFATLYEGAGLMTTTDSGVNVMAGATLGGGTRINWSASFRTPDHVRREWARELGLTAFEGPRFTAALDAVCARIGVSTGVQRHNRNNTALKDGLEALGVHCEEIPRNCDNTGHECGYCCFGCASGGKRDASGTWLLDAVGAGAFAERVLTQPACAGGGRGMRARGVAVAPAVPGGAGAGGPRVAVRAPIVVASAGTLHTPALLLRSGLDGGGRVGANLRLHPATVGIAFFPKGWKAWPEELWNGPIMSVYSHETGDWDGSGYGTILETPCKHHQARNGARAQSHPGVVGAAVPWAGGAAWQREGVDLPRSSGVLVIARDSGSGRITLGEDGLPRIEYWPSARDSANMLDGLELGLRALVAAGATRVRTLQQGAQAVHDVARAPDGALADPAAFEAYLAGVRAFGIQPCRTTVFSAHQMGTAAMGVDPATSVVDPQGQSWQVAGLYVADGSVLPTPSGVNPMVSIESVAYLIAEGLAERVRKPRQVA